MSKKTMKPARPARQTPAQPPAPAPARAAQDVLTMDEAIAILKTTRPTFYRWLREGKIKGAKAGRQWRFRREDIERFIQGLEPRVDLPVGPGPLIDQLEARLGQAGRSMRQTIEDSISTAVNMMLLFTYQQRASDLHICPHYDGTSWSIMIRHRIDGLLHEVATADIRLLGAMADRFKHMASLNVAQKGLPQDGRITVSINGEEVDLRLATVPAMMGESITLRILRRDALRLELDKFGWAPRDLERIREAIHAPWGLIVCNGPTGSGKTTTLYACLGELAGPQVKCVAVEDPVEYLLPWITQVAVNEQAGLTFARAIRAFMRAAPNVIMVGEIRDLEVLESCLQAAMTGHLVLTSLHAPDSAAALQRMMDVGAPPLLVGDATRLIISQRLVRRLCPHCSKPAAPSAEEEAMVAQTAVTGGLAMAELPRDYRQPVGCDKCGRLGYRGQMVVAEAMSMSAALSKALRERANVDELRRIAVAEGMTTIQADGVRKAAAGITTLREVQRVRGA